jgi:hypothetical protein
MESDKEREAREERGKGEKERRIRATRNTICIKSKIFPEKR